MKVAEIYASLGLKIEGSDQAELKAFDDLLKNIAQSARNAALALKILARTTIPKGALAAMTKPPARTTAPAITPATVPGVTTPAPNPGTPPLLATSAPKPPTSVTMGLAALSKLALSLVGINSLVGLIKRLISGIGEMVNNSRRQALVTDRLAMETGLSRREIKGFERLGALGGMQKGDVQGILSGLAERAQAVKLGIGDASAFTFAGANPYDNPAEIIRKFHERHKGLSAAQEIQFGKGLGISPELIYSLRKFGDQLDKIFKDAELNDQQQASVLKLNEAWQTMTFNAGVLADKITSDLAPAISVLIKGLGDLAQLFAMVSPKGRQAAMALPGYGSIALVPAMMDLMKFMPRHAGAGGGTSVNITNNNNVSATGMEKPGEVARMTAKAIVRSTSDAFYGRAVPQE